MSKSIVSGKKHLCENMSFVVREAFKKIRTNTIFALPQNNDCKVIGVTSAQPGEGKSTNAINLAYSFSELGKKVLLMDADMRRPSISEKLDLDFSVGLGDLLTDADEVKAAIIPYGKETDEVSFDIICGSVVNNQSELLSSPRFSLLLKTLTKVYDYIIIDLPPVDAVIDAVIVGKHTDGVIVVARENETSKKLFDYCIKQLEFPGVKILGLIFNASIDGVGEKYQYKY